MPTFTPPATVVCGLDGSPECGDLARISSSIARLLGARLELVHVLGAHDMTAASRDPLIHAQAMLDALVDASDVEHATGHLFRFGEPARRIATLAEDRAARLIVVGTHGMDPIPHALLGSVSSRLAADAPCPVLVIPPGNQRHIQPDTWRNRTIVCGFDGSTASLSAAVHASLLTTTLGGSVNLLTVDSHFPSTICEAVESIRREVRRRLERADESEHPPINISVQRRLGDPAWELNRVAAAITAPLIAISSRGMGPWHDPLLGPVARRVLLAARRPILVTPASLLEPTEATSAVDRSAALDERTGIDPADAPVRGQLVSAR